MEAQKDLPEQERRQSQLQSSKIGNWTYFPWSNCTILNDLFLCIQAVDFQKEEFCNNSALHLHINKYKLT